MAIWPITLWLDSGLTPDEHAPLGLARLTQMYRGDQPRQQAYLEAFLDQVQSAEDVALEVLTGMWPWTAIGVQLDNLGVIVGQARGALTDPEYRLFILGRIFVNKGDGQLPQFIELLVDILEQAEPVQIFEFWPALLHVAAYEIAYPDTIGDLLFDLRGGGIRLDWVHSPLGLITYDGGITFTYNVFRCSSQLAVDDASQAEGTANIAYTTGGYLPFHRWTP